MSARLHRTPDVAAVSSRAQGIDITPEEIPGQPHALILRLAGCIHSYNLLGFVAYFSITGSV